MYTSGIWTGNREESIYDPKGEYAASLGEDAYKSPDPYKAPLYDERKVRSMTQTELAPSLRGLRSSMQRISGMSSDNPNAKRMTLREALAGYGQGLQSATTGASASARNAYNQEYEIKSNESLVNYKEAQNSARLNFENQQREEAARYQAELQKYLKSTYGNGGGGVTSVSNGADWSRWYAEDDARDADPNRWKPSGGISEDEWSRWYDEEPSGETTESDTYDSNGDEWSRWYNEDTK